MVISSSKDLLDCIKIYWMWALLVGTAFFLYMLVIMPSGSVYCLQNGECGVFFWGAHEHDALWHISLIKSAFVKHPFSLPIFAGEGLKGYNYLFDLLLSYFSKFGLSPSLLYFKVVPLFWFVSFATVLIIFLRRMHGFVYPSDNAVMLKRFVAHGLLITFFSCSFGYIFTIFHEGRLENSSSLFPMQSAMAMTNPQFMWSTIFLVLILGIVVDFLNKKYISKTNLLILTISLFAMLGLKVYSVVIIPSVLMVVFAISLRGRKYGDLIKISLSILLAVLVAYLLFYKRENVNMNVFSLKPFALFKSIYADSRFLNMPQIGATWDILESSNRLSPKLLVLQIAALIVFLFASFGARIVGFVVIVGSLRRLIGGTLSNKDRLVLILSFFIVLFSIPSVVLVQSGEWWNTIQFFYYAIFLSNFILLIYLYDFIRRSSSRMTIFVFVLLAMLFLPAQIDTVNNFSGLRRAAYLPYGEYLALVELEAQEDGVVLTQPFYPKNTDDYMSGSKFEGYSIPLPDRMDVAYVSAYSGKQVYYENENQLKLLQVDGYLDRKAMLSPLKCTDAILKDIQYIYIRLRHRDQSYRECANANNFDKIFNNSEIEIWANQK